MRRWQHTTIAIMILGTLLFCSTSSNATSINAYQDVFIEHLEMGPATYLNLNVHGRVTAEIDKLLTELYHNNKLQPFWIEDGKPGQRAVDIVSVLKEAESHGLNPDSYFVHGRFLEKVVFAHLKENFSIKYYETSQTRLCA